MSTHFPAKPFQAEAQAIVARQREEADRTSPGASWGGLQTYTKVEDVETVRQRLVAQDRASADFARSPLGRFFFAVRELEALGWTDEAGTLEAIYRQSLTPLNGPEINTEAALRAIRVLNGVDHSTAREAITALCDYAAPMMREAA